jgi:uncharacterized C2H2 Zn-finger protein
MNIVRKSILNENPDIVHLNSRDNYDYLRYDRGEAYAFGYVDSKMYLSHVRGTHSYMKIPGKTEVKRFSMQYPGRVWTDEKIMSFWKYPPANQFKAVMDDLSKALSDKLGKKINIMNDNEWYIEVLTDSKGDVINDPKEVNQRAASMAWSNPPSPSEMNDYPDRNKHTVGYRPIIIPVDQYVGSQQRSEKDLAQQHVVSPLLKKKKEVPQGYGSKNPKYRSNRAWQMASLTSESAINENPDAVFDVKTGGVIEFDRGFNVAFSYANRDKTKMLVGTETHRDLRDPDGDNRGRETRGPNSGRLFVDKKIITFWRFPEDYQDLVKTLQDLEKAIQRQLNRTVNILSNDEWRIEMPEDENALRDSGWGSWSPEENEQTFVPINKYKGGPVRSEKELAQQHVLSPLLKQKKAVPPGWGSNSERYKKKRQWQMADLAAESFSFEGFQLYEGEKEFWNDELDLEDKIDISGVVREICKEYGKDCVAARFKIKKLLKPIHDFSDDFVKWLIKREQLDNYDREIVKKPHFRRAVR